MDSPEIIPHYIDGTRTGTVGDAPSDGRTADVYDPNTGRVQAQVPLASAAEVRTAVQIAKTAQKQWAAKNPQQRARVMMRFVDLVSQNMDELPGDDPAVDVPAGHRLRQHLHPRQNHLVVLPDADLDEVADALIGAGYGSAGERCMAISVAVPVGEKTADALREKLAERVRELRQAIRNPTTGRW